jgi:hypothetical protein
MIGGCSAKAASEPASKVVDEDNPKTLSRIAQHIAKVATARG